VALIALLLTVLHCGGHRGARSTYHDANMDFGLIQSVAVLPFDNLSLNGKAGETVRDVFMTMLQASVDIYVVPAGEVRRAVSRVQPDDPKAPTEEEFVNLAKNLEVDVLITGTVLEYGEVRSGAAASNVCSVNVQMIEGQTGRIVWSASATRGGVTAGDRLVGGGGQPMNIIVSKTVGDLLDRLFK
jgi:TolB-like protein